MKKIFSLLLLVIFITGCSQKFETIATDKALELMDSGAIVLDVRTNEEYNTGHIAGAINLPLDQIETINYAKDAVLIVYCATSERSMEAINKLSDMGYTSLYNLDGGLINWGMALEE